MDEKNREVAGVFDEYEAEYSETVNKSLNFSGLNVDFFTKVKTAYIVDVIDEHFDDAGSVRLLDVGCGVGNYHGILEPHLGGVVGVDISESSVERARSINTSIDYHSYDGIELPFQDDAFDVALTICVMHHVPPENWEKFASEMKRVVRPGGLALIFEHNPNNPLSVHVVNNCPFDEDAVLLRSKRTKELFRNAGFANVAANFIISIPPFNSLLRKVDRLFSKIPLGAQYYVVAKKD